MRGTAEEHAVALTTNRNCVMEITNLSNVFCLCNPRVHMESGFPYSPPQPTIRTNMVEVCSFTKDDHMPSGAVGVLTYELFNIRSRSCTELVAVMFSVPFDYNFYENWLGVGVFEKTRACDEALFKHMYKEDSSNFVRHKADGSAVTHKGKVVEVRACMSDEGKAIIKLELYDKMSL